MTNWVFGNLDVTGDKQELSKFKEFAENEEEYYDEDIGDYNKRKNILDINKFIPYPQKFKDIDKKNKEYFDKLRAIKMKVENQEKLTSKEKKIANKLILVELEADRLPYRKDGYNSGGHEFCVQKWGTKWNFRDTELNEKDYGTGNLHYTFQTAYNVPMPVLFKMSKMFPKLTFDYYGDEESEEFEVEYTFKAGKLTNKDEKQWAEIQIEKIEEGNIDGFDYDKNLYKELEKHKGHEIKEENKEFRCKTCDNKLIWDTSK